MAIDPLAAAPTGRDFPAELLSSIAQNLPKFIRQVLNAQIREHDGMDAFKSETVLSAVYHLTMANVAAVNFKHPKGFVGFDQFKANATKRSASDFINFLKEAVDGNDERLWPRVVNHGSSPDLPVYGNCSFLNS
jgi:hypothetical protein